MVVFLSSMEGLNVLVLTYIINKKKIKVNYLNLVLFQRTCQEDGRKTREGMRRVCLEERD